MQIELMGSSDGEFPMVSGRTMRSLIVDGQTFIAVYDLAHLLEIDRNRLVRRLKGHARLVTAIDLDGVVRNLVVAPAEAFIKKQQGQRTPETDPPAQSKLNPPLQLPAPTERLW